MRRLLTAPPADWDGFSLPLPLDGGSVTIVEAAGVPSFALLVEDDATVTQAEWDAAPVYIDQAAAEKPAAYDRLAAAYDANGAYLAAADERTAEDTAAQVAALTAQLNDVIVTLA